MNSRFVCHAVAAVLAAISCLGQAGAQQVTGTLGSPSATTTHQRQAAAAARSEVRRGDQGEGLGVDAVVAAARRAAEEARPTCC